MTSLLVFFLSIYAQAGLLEFHALPSKVFRDDGVEVPVYSETTLHVEGITPKQGIKLYLSGAGLRKKKFAIFKVDVYYATHYVDSKVKFTEQAMKGILQTKYRVMQMTMLRDLDVETIREAFTESLTVNGIDAKKKGIASLLTQLNINIKKGQTLTFVGYPAPNGMQGVAYELMGKIRHTKDKSLADNFWSIWFGVMADSGLEDLKVSLTSTM